MSVDTRRLHDETHSDRHDHAAKRDLAALLLGLASLLLALTLLLWVLWQILAPVRATPFDADGVRCYSKASQTSCLQTANPPR